MCFYVEEEHQEKLTATEDIICYKVGQVLLDGEFVSEARSYMYKPGKLYRLFPKFLTTRNLFDGGERVIYSGFHSYTTQQAAVFNCAFGYDVAKFRIPKGAKYYVSPIYSTYVSNRIIFDSFVQTRVDEEELKVQDFLLAGQDTPH